LGASQSRLLHGHFPAHVLQAIMRGEQSKPDASDCATVFFCKVSGISRLISSPEAYLKRAELLDQLFAEFDLLALEHGVQRVDTIGECYLGVTNLVESQQSDHVASMIRFSCAVSEVTKKANFDAGGASTALGGCLKLRIGLNSGPLTGSVVGYGRKKYTVFGNTVNIASRMESTGTAGYIQCSERTASLLNAQDEELGRNLRVRGKVFVKGKGEMTTFLFLLPASQGRERQSAGSRPQRSESVGGVIGNGSSKVHPQ